jgi:hypothetical protein
MPRISLWKDGQHSNDYKFMDRRISEMFTIGGTGIHLHKYVGTKDQGNIGDVTTPSYATQSEQNIQDLLFVENRDRKYDDDVYELRAHYTRGDSDFDLSQFGIFLTGATIIVTFHINDMVSRLGRKIIAGDVMELPHLKDFNALDEELPAALKRYYVAGDASFASEGFTPTWWPHLWRVKFDPMVDSQEYKDILNKIAVEGNSTTISQILSTYDKNIAINDAVIQQAEAEVPKSGFDVEHIFELKEFTTTDDLPSADDIGITADDTGESKSTDTTGAPINASNDSATTQNTEQRVEGYLTQAIFDGTIGSGLSFPASPAIGDHYLRIDFLPNRLFKYDGKRWVKQVDDLRTNITNNASGNQTQRASFMRNNTTYVDPADSTNTLQERQSLSKAFTPKADNNG